MYLGSKSKSVSIDSVAPSKSTYTTSPAVFPSISVGSSNQVYGYYTNGAATWRLPSEGVYAYAYTTISVAPKMSLDLTMLADVVSGVKYEVTFMSTSGAMSQSESASGGAVITSSASTCSITYYRLS